MSDKTSEDLLNCPFCGGEAELKYERQNFPFSEERNSFVVTCKNCGCSTSYFSEMNIYYSKDYKEKEKELKEKTIKTWNTRKPMERILERLEEYRDDFMNDIYEELRDDTDNLRANRIIDRFDEAIAIVMEEGGLND